MPSLDTGYVAFLAEIGDEIAAQETIDLSIILL